MKQNERLCRIHAAAKYPLLASQVFLLLLFVPVLVVALGDMNGRTMQDAVSRSWRMIASPDSIFMFWAPIVLCAMIIFGYLSPVMAFACNRSFARNPRQAAKLALKRLNGMNAFIIVLGIAGFSLGELMSQLATGTMGTFTLSGKFMLFNAISKGLLSSVIISFNLDNILFPAKKAAVEALPEKRLRKTSLYRRITLVVTTIIVFLIFQFMTTATELYDLGNKLMALNLSQFDAYRVLEEGPLSADIHNLLAVIYAKGFIYLAFVFELVLQLKYMIQHPLETMKDKLVRLNSDDISTINSIDILVNDEFSGVYREINSLIKRQQSELECSSNRLESIVVLAADPIISFDQSGKILLFNPAAERFFGYSGEEALKLSIQAMIEIPEGDDTWCAGCSTAEAIARLLRGERNGISRFSGIRKDGTRAMFESNVSSAESPGATIFTAIIRDISKQIELERGLTEAKVAAENANRLK
ncbi:MAG TPA: PAS domain S-box protein, partial [Treponemataceae bacterium]|nr:PAS domain S-box protein [Treponemataceae bacterium]